MLSVENFSYSLSVFKNFNRPSGHTMDHRLIHFGLEGQNMSSSVYKRLLKFWLCIHKTTKT